MIDFLHILTDRSVQLLDVSATGLLLADPREAEDLAGAAQSWPRFTAAAQRAGLAPDRGLLARHDEPAQRARGIWPQPVRGPRQQPANGRDDR